MSCDIRREEGVLYTPEPHLRAGHSRQHQLHSLWAWGEAGWPQGSSLQTCSQHSAVETEQSSSRGPDGLR